MVTSHKYYDNQLRDLQRKAKYLKDDIRAIQQRLATSLYCDELGRNVSMGELVRMIQTLEDRFPDVETGSE